MMCACETDAYWNKGRCWKCGAKVGTQPETTYKDVALLRLPRPIEEQRRVLWDQYIPWKHMNYDYAVQFGFYFSRLEEYGKKDVHLVMPIYHKSKLVFFSARRLEGSGSKYFYPPGFKREPFLHEEDNCITFITEGAADAVHLTRFGNTVGLLGTNMIERLVDWKWTGAILICMDNDTAGLLASFRIVARLQGASSKILVLPGSNTDPLDYSHDELREIIKDFVDEHSVPMCDMCRSEYD